ncbi:Trk K+ transport system, NAD-binding component [Fodinibius roseus]|uniref:Trk K+ transport system, NAD-binding component n=1 Tax=Fodinibius roseus TaxID=1194090 RepID=A0A1M4ZTK9_9BACT|nr:NAD-binding protein [Fodinibius roseus]SHF21112.1 Trk K+ transport system, NAD-binding component [Fodinibius roseus]
MKFFTSQLTQIISTRGTRYNIKRLARFLAILTAVIVIYSIFFHFIMQYEGQYYSWVTGFYWTLTVMSTLGFGDITFTSDLGRAFSILVLLSGMLSLLILLPFTFIQFFYAPWLEAQSKARAPRELPEDIRDHVIITHYNPISRALMEKLDQYNYRYVLLVSDLTKALEYYDEGYKVVFGELDDPETYKKIRVNQAAMVVSLGTDMVNSNICNTVREMDEDVAIVATANSADSIDLLKMAGCDHVIRIGDMMGRALSRRTIGQDSRIHVLGRFDSMIIAEAMAYETPLVGKTLKENKLRERMGINLVGIWERGKFLKPHPDLSIKNESILIMSGSPDQLRTYDEFMSIYRVSDEPVIIIGAGRVGRGIAEAFDERGLDYRIIDKNPDRIKDDERYILGSAEDFKVLEKAGIQKAPCVLVTTHDDDMNIYLTIYVRRLRPNIQIISRSTLQRNVNTLHRAGSDFVLSYATMGANAIFNILERNDIIIIAEGLNVFTAKTPSHLAGKSLKDSFIRQETGCNVLSIKTGDEQIINPPPDLEIPAESELVLVGTNEDEMKFMDSYKE